jgi:large subunit ribosomal protein L23
MSVLKRRKAAALAPKPVHQPAHPEHTAGTILYPLVTEKAAHLASQQQYAFRVSPAATKVQVTQAIVARYGIRPAHVTVANYGGKRVRVGRREGRRRDWRRAIVTLPAGQTLPVIEGT